MQARLAQHWFSCFVCILTLLALGATGCWAQGMPPASAVPEPYRQNFVKYIDGRSWKEKALNLIGLTSDHVGRSFALIAGVSKYPNLPSDKQLPAAGTDVNQLQAYLQNEEFFDEIVVLKDGDVSEERLKYFLEDYFAERVKRFPNSRFLFAYSGHGFSDGPKEYPNGHLLKSTARSLTDKENSINMTVLRTYFNEVADAGYQSLVLINACESGAFLANRPFGDHVGPRAAGGIYFPTQSGAHAITAGGSGQLSWHVPKVGPGSVFFEKLLAGLGGQADTFPVHSDGSRGDGIITVDEIATYLREEVALATNRAQTPIPADLAPNRSLGGFFFLNRQKMVDAGIVPRWPPKGGTSFGPDANETTQNLNTDIKDTMARNTRPSSDQSGNIASGTTQAKIGVPASLALSVPDAALTPEAKKERGDKYHYGRGVEQDYQQAREWYERAAADGNTEAMRLLSRMYEVAEGGPEDHQQAARWAEKAAVTGDAEGMFSIGYYYESGLGVARDYMKARQWYEKCAAAGNTLCVEFLGGVYEAGEGVPPDHQVARQWYEKAAAAGAAGAMYKLGRLYEESGTNQDYPRARQWYEKAAKAGNHEAMYKLGRLYEEGHGGPQDYQLAQQWYEKAAEAGNRDAMRSLGWMYDIGRVTQDDQQARHWYERAAVAGDPRAMYYLGYLYETGRGGPKDYDQAREWYEKAKMGGDPDARTRLEGLPR